jgi:hypothetical protein
METPKSLEREEYFNGLEGDLVRHKKKIEKYKEFQRDFLKLERARNYHDLWTKSKLVYRNIQTLIEHEEKLSKGTQRQIEYAKKLYAVEVLSERLNEDVAKKIVGFI